MASSVHKDIAVHKDSYGFIRIVEGIPDWFFHVSELKGHAFPVGTPITFDAGIDRARPGVLRS